MLIFIPAVLHASAKLFNARWRPDSVEKSRTKSTANSRRLICNFQSWGTHQLGCICRSNSCKQWKGEVTKRTLAGVQRPHGTVLIACHLPEHKPTIGSRNGNRSGRPAGQVEILRPAGQAGRNTGQILLSCNQKTSKHQPKYMYIFYYK